MLKTINILSCKIAGFRPMAISRSEDALGLPATFGILLLLVSTISGVTMAYAIFRVFYGAPNALLAATLAGLIWFPFIFCVDRLMLNTTTTGSIWSRVIKIVGRCALAIIVGLTISEPVFLRLQRNNIDLAIYLTNRDMEARQAGENAALAGFPDSQADYTHAMKEAQRAQDRVDAGPGNYAPYAAAIHTLDAAEAAQRATEARYLPQIISVKAKRKALPPDSPEEADLATRIQQLYVPIGQARKAVAEAKSDVAQVEQAWHDLTNQQLTKAQGYEQSTLQRRDAAEEKRDKADAFSTKQINDLSTPNLATEFASAERVMHDAHNPESASMRKAAYGIHALFIILELMVVSLKLTAGTGALDNATAACEEEDRERNTLIANNRILRMQAAAEAAMNIYLEALLKLSNDRQAGIAARTAISTQDLDEVKTQCEELIETSK